MLQLVRLASELHEGQKDKAGEPYLGHLLRVASRLPSGVGPDVLAAALLHDAVEDGRATFDGLAGVGVSARAIALVALLSRRAGEAYEAYLERVKSDPEAVLVKRADLADNLDPVRLRALPADKAAALAQKYNRALEILNA